MTKPRVMRYLRCRLGNRHAWVYASNDGRCEICGCSIWDQRKPRIRIIGLVIALVLA